VRNARWSDTRLLSAGAPSLGRNVVERAKRAQPVQLPHLERFVMIGFNNTGSQGEEWSDVRHLMNHSSWRTPLVGKMLPKRRFATWRVRSNTMT
jgi:hypothetical protein